MRRAKIVATLGPASSDLATLTRLVEAGVNVVRLNFSHGTADDHRKRVENLFSWDSIAEQTIRVYQRAINTIA